MKFGSRSILRGWTQFVGGAFPKTRHSLKPPEATGERPGAVYLHLQRWEEVWVNNSSELIGGFVPGNKGACFNDSKLQEDISTRSFYVFSKVRIC